MIVVLSSPASEPGRLRHLRDRWLTDRPLELVVCPILIEREAETWAHSVEMPPITGDPKDDELVALHRSCQADLLVSGDPERALAADDVTTLTQGDLLEHLRS